MISLLIWYAAFWSGAGFTSSLAFIPVFLFTSTSMVSVFIWCSAPWWGVFCLHYMDSYEHFSAGTVALHMVVMIVIISYCERCLVGLIPCIKIGIFLYQHWNVFFLIISFITGSLLHWSNALELLLDTMLDPFFLAALWSVVCLTSYLAWDLFLADIRVWRCILLTPLLVLIAVECHVCCFNNRFFFF